MFFWETVALISAPMRDGAQRDDAPILSCSHLTMRFGGLLAVSDLSFSVRAGDIHGLIGPNGAGKTTIFNVMSGFYKPTSGGVMYRGENIAGLKMHIIAAKGLVRTFQHTSLFHELTVLENVLVGCHLWQKPRLLPSLLGAQKRSDGEKQAMEALDFFGIANRRDEWAGDLPYGLQRAVGMAVALTVKPQVLLLDEPFTGMNPEEIRQMMEQVRKIQRRGITLLLVEHDMRAIMGLCERITVVNFGCLLAEGAPDEICKHPQVIEAYLGSTRHAVAH